MFGFNNVNLNIHTKTFSKLATNHAFNQKLPLLLIGQIEKQELQQLRKQITEIIKARAQIEFASLDDIEAIRNSLKALVEHNVGNVIELGDGRYVELTKLLTTQLSAVLQRSGFFHSIGLIQRFPNIRIKIGPFSAEQEHYSHPLSTAKMHCDIWAGAAKELQICIMEILNINNGPKVEFAEVSGFPSSLAKKLSGYDDPNAVKFLQKKIKRRTLSEEGFLHVLGGFTPHRTIYPGHGLRVSIDFRIVLKENLSPQLAQDLKVQFCDPKEW